MSNKKFTQSLSTSNVAIAESPVQQGQAGEEPTMPIDAPYRLYTPDEYLELEEQADCRHEYHDGDIIPMAGGTTNHNELALNLAAYLKQLLRKQNYRVYIGDVRLWIPRYRQYNYPDVMVIQGEPIYQGSGTTTVTNPRLIAEVLSQSTQDYDQGGKFTYYRSLPDLHDYVLIDQYQYRVMHYTKTAEGKWLLTDIQGEQAILAIADLEIDLPLVELYSGVTFDQADESID